MWSSRPGSDEGSRARREAIRLANTTEAEVITFDPGLAGATSTLCGNGSNAAVAIVANAGTMDFDYQNTFFTESGGANIVARGPASAGVSITSPGNNLLDASPAEGAAHDAAAGHRRDTAALPAPRGDYGGATLKLRPPPDSLAIDVGRCLADDPLVPEDDQRGVYRPKGNGGDIGAVELALIGVAFVASCHFDLDSRSRA